jgi:hypothetical protein
MKTKMNHLISNIPVAVAVILEILIQTVRAVLFYRRYNLDEIT